MVNDLENSYQESTKQPSFQWGRNKAVQNPEQQTNASENFRVPPDGGCRAYVIVIASFCINGFIFGIMNSYSIIYVVLLKKLQSQNVDQAEMKASLCGVLTIGCTFAISPVTGILLKFFGLRATAMVGGAIGTIGLVWSSFVADDLAILWFSYGILYGLGSSLAYTPSLAILGQYFKKYIGVVNGVVTVGSSVFTVIFPPLMELMIKYHDLGGMFLVLSIFEFGIILCSSTFKPFIKKQKSVKSFNGCKPLCRIIIGTELWKIKLYTLWAICIPVAMLGYFVPYVYIKQYIKDLHFEDYAMDLPLQGLAITSAIGRLSFGFLSDKRWINKIILQQISYFAIGWLTIMLSIATKFWVIVLIALGMGLCEGAFISLMGPIAFELCGHEHAAQGIGCILGILACPMFLGPPLAGLLYSYTKTYTLPFVISGLMPIIGATLMFTIHLKKFKANQIEINAPAVSGV